MTRANILLLVATSMVATGCLRGGEAWSPTVDPGLVVPPRGDDLDLDGVMGDDTGQPGLASTPATGHAPLAVFEAPEAVSYGDVVTLDATGSADPDGEILDYRWDFDRSNGMGVDLRGRRVTWVYSTPGVYEVTLRVVDDQGKVGVAVRAVAVEGVPPVADAGEDSVARVGQPVVLDGSGSYDADGGLSSWWWDANASDGIDQDAGGASATWVYTDPGTYVATLTVTDIHGLSARDTVRVDVTP